MNNPLLNNSSNLRSSGNQEMGVNPQQLAQVKQLMSAVRQSPNPILFIQNMYKQNPMLQQAMNLIQSNGNNMQQVAQMLAQQRGVDLNDLINKLQS